MKRHLSIVVAGALTLGACDGPRVSEATPDDHVRGPDTARVTLIEYGDYQCPPCTNTNRDLEALLAKYPNDLRLIYRHFPIRPHRNARLAAEAAEAAEAQGRFWEMHAKLFERQKEWYGASDPVPLFTRYAEELGMDGAGFTSALRSHRFERRVAKAHEQARHFGVRGAPAFFVNGRRLIPPPHSRDALEKQIQRELSP
ncbi:MAG: DsbA family protein [Thermoanaerobaculia bacterium]|nr:DsbA family protein [Thermoanaerobaculia bacterium]